MPRGINQFDEDRLDGLNFGDANSSNIVSPGIVTDGLVMHLDAGNYQSYPISGTTWHDLVSERTGTLSPGTGAYTPSYVLAGGGSIRFQTGTNTCNLSSPPPVAGKAVTFDVWNYGTTWEPSNIIWLPNASGQRQLSIHLGFINERIYFDAGDGATYDRIDKVVTTAEYQGWVHWAFVKDSDAGTMVIYRNAISWHSGTGLTKTIGTPSSAQIGIECAGDISNLRFYNRALTPTEVAQNFNALRSRFNI